MLGVEQLRAAWNAACWKLFLSISSSGESNWRSVVCPLQCLHRSITEQRNKLVFRRHSSSHISRNIPHLCIAGRRHCVVLGLEWILRTCQQFGQFHLSWSNTYRAHRRWSAEILIFEWGSWTFLTFSSPPGVVSLASGYYHNCVILVSGAVWCWGENDHGQLGTGAAASSVANPAHVNLGGEASWYYFFCTITYCGYETSDHSNFLPFPIWWCARLSSFPLAYRMCYGDANLF